MYHLNFDSDMVVIRFVVSSFYTSCSHHKFMNTVCINANKNTETDIRSTPVKNELNHHKTLITVIWLLLWHNDGLVDHHNFIIFFTPIFYLLLFQLLTIILLYIICFIKGFDDTRVIIIEIWQRSDSDLTAIWQRKYNASCSGFR